MHVRIGLWLLACGRPQPRRDWSRCCPQPWRRGPDGHRAQGSAAWAPSGSGSLPQSERGCLGRQEQERGRRVGHAAIPAGIGNANHPALEHEREQRKREDEPLGKKRDHAPPSSSSACCAWRAAGDWAASGRAPSWRRSWSSGLAASTVSARISSSTASEAMALFIGEGGLWLLRRIRGETWQFKPGRQQHLFRPGRKMRLDRARRRGKRLGPAGAPPGDIVTSPIRILAGLACALAAQAAAVAEGEAPAFADLVLKGDAADAQFRPESALGFYLRANEAHPNDPKVLLKIAKEYSDSTLAIPDADEDRRRIERALAYSKRAVELDPRSEVGLLSIAVCYGKLGLYSDTREKDRLRQAGEGLRRAGPGREPGLRLRPPRAWPVGVRGRVAGPHPAAPGGPGLRRAPVRLHRGCRRSPRARGAA